MGAGLADILQAGVQGRLHLVQVVAAFQEVVRKLLEANKLLQVMCIPIFHTHVIAFQTL